MRLGWKSLLFALTTLILALAATHLLVGSLSSVDRSYEDRATQQAQIYERAAERIKNGCGRAAISAAQKAVCKSNADDTYEQKYREEYNLAAQQSAAWWTKIGGKATVYGGAIGIVSLALIFITLWQNLEQTRLANAVFEAERRPILVPDGIEVRQWSGEQWEFQFRWKNIGPSPALIEFEETRKFFADIETVASNMDAVLAATDALWPGDSYTLRWIVLPDKTYCSRSGQFTLQDAQQGAVFAHSMIRYRLATSDLRKVWETEVAGILNPWVGG